MANSGDFCCERLENFMLASLPLLRSIMDTEEPPLDGLILYPNTFVCGSEENNESAGLALITRNQAVLWTECELFNFQSIEFANEWTVMDSRTSGIKQWILENLPNGSIIGFEQFSVSIRTVDSWEESFMTVRDMVLVPITLGHIWMSAECITPANIHSANTNQYIVRTLMESIGMWGETSSGRDGVSGLYGLRAADIPMYPVAIVALLTVNSSVLYVHQVDTLSETAIQHFYDCDIEVRDWSELSEDAEHLALELRANRGREFYVHESVPYGLLVLI